MSDLKLHHHGERFESGKREIATKTPPVANLGALRNVFLASVLAVLGDANKDKIVVGLEGLPGTGKTSTVEMLGEIAKEAGVESVNVLSVDDHLATPRKERLEAMKRIRVPEEFWSIYYNRVGLEATISEAINAGTHGSEVIIPEMYIRDRGIIQKGTIKVNPGSKRIVIVEGFRAGDSVKSVCDQLGIPSVNIGMVTHFDDAMRRAIERDTKKGRTPEAAREIRYTEAPFIRPALEETLKERTDIYFEAA